MPDPVTVAKSAQQVAVTGSWLWRWWRPATSPTALAGQAGDLAGTVERAETRRLEQLGVAIRRTSIDVSYEVLPGVHAAGGADIGSLRDVEPYYRTLETGRLVVLGAPGAGKTVLALHLLLGLLDNRDPAASQRRRVPLRINAASWDTGTSFDEWVSATLVTDFGLKRHLARHLVLDRWILPVLDGLDEMDAPGASPQRARAALDHLNRSPWAGQPVIVMCRSEVYENARNLAEPGQDAGLHDATAVTISSLTSEQIFDHLVARQEAIGAAPESWAPLTDLLITEPDGMLHAALSTPWMLTLATADLARRGRYAAVDLAATRSAAQVEGVLFSALIPAAVAAQSHKGTRTRYTTSQVHAWLHNLATHLDDKQARGRGGTDVSLDGLWELAGRRLPRFLHALVSVLLLSLSAGLVVGLAAGLSGGLAVGLVVGLAFGPWLGWGSAEPNRLVLRTNRPHTLRRRFLSALPTGLVIGLAAGLITGLGAGLMAGVAVGLAVGLAVGFLTALLRGSQITGVRTTNEQSAIRDDYVAVLVFWLTTGLIVGLAAGLTTGLTPADDLGLVPSLGGGLALGLGFGLALATAGVRYSCATFLFACTGRFARRPRPFLNWCRTAGLLRVTGSAYQFRHETYQHWLRRSVTPDDH